MIFEYLNINFELLNTLFTNFEYLNTFRGLKMANSDEFNNEVYESILNNFKTNSIFAKGKNGVNNIVIFDEPEVKTQKTRYRIGYSNIMIIENNKPILAIETVTKKPTPPKEIAGPIPVYMIARKLIINMKNGNQEEYNLTNSYSKFKLLVVVPDQPNGHQKSAQIKDLNEKFKGVFDLNNEYSNLKDFEICEFSAINSALNRLMKI